MKKKSTSDNPTHNVTLVNILKKLIIILIILTVFYSCKIFQESINNGIRTFAVVTIPDTCEILLLEEIKNYRIDNQIFPNNQDIEKLKGKLSNTCKKSIDSIEMLSYNIDSMDLVFQKRMNDTTLKFNSILKGYRFIFIGDTLKEIRILHNNIKYKSELLGE